MNKILSVARSEYFMAVNSKAFIIGVIMMPIFMGGTLVVQRLTKDQIDITDRKIAIVDESGQLGDILKQASDMRNEKGVYEVDDDGSKKQTQAKFDIELVAPATSSTDWLDVKLSERVKDEEIFAFAFIDKDIIDPTKDARIRYHSETPSYRTLPNWLEGFVNAQVRMARTAKLGVSPQDMASVSKSADLKMFGLVEVGPDGTRIEAKEENRILTFAVPFVGLMLMFMMVMSVAPAMLNNVLEEKMQKISEFLISSVTPFQLMMGKLVGAVGIGLSLSAIYLGAAFALAMYFEVSDRVPLSLYLWFVFFLFLALIIFGSIFSAVGAACSEIRDAQSLMTPVMLVIVIPMMCMGPILNSPSSTFAKLVSLFPPATPMLMFARIAIPPGPAAWEIITAVILSTGFTLLCVWAAGRVFRVGILSQGQAPTLGKLLKWIVTQ